ncbi:MAG: phosphatase PAP2 family protein [Candidatus Daviesbacteria bacterium]
MKYRFFIFLLFFIYIIGMTALMVWQGIGIAPDRYVFVLLLGSLLIRRTRSFLLDWIPFLFILISYDFLRGLAPILNTNVHYWELINADEFLFGKVPSIILQNNFFHAQQLAWYDYLATIFDFLHFALLLAFGYLLWLYHKGSFRQFVIGISLLSYAAWATFVIYPAAPPWMAAQKGYLPEVTKIMDSTLAAFPAAYEFPTIYHRMNPNPVAAMPSLHAAYPFLVLLFALSFFKLKGIIFLPYVLGVWISLVYLGEHYVIDILAGVIYATIFFLVARKMAKHIQWLNISD